MDEYIHHSDSKIDSSDAFFLAHFGAPPIFRTKEIDKTNKKSLFPTAPRRSVSTAPIDAKTRFPLCLMTYGSVAFQETR
jgi:hypothetical protein